jgi:hypothetical protein
MTAVPLINIGGIGPGRDDTANLNVLETYTLSIVRGGRRTGQRQAITDLAGGGTTFKKPVDLAGFPNGRRPGDDVVDVALRVVEGILLSSSPSTFPKLTEGAFINSTVAYDGPTFRLRQGFGGQVGRYIFQE